MNSEDPNIRLVEGLVKHLAELKDDFVFVGGCATGLLITDPGRPPVRPTTDVDLVTSVATRSDYYRLAEKLRERGFSENPQSDVLCRWQIGKFDVDIMPIDGRILGFSNRWYPQAVQTASQFILPNREAIKLITAPLFVATKLEAFHDRGKGDYGVSHDMEDILTVIDGRPEFADELNAASPQISEYLKDEIETLLSDQDFVDKISWHLAVDDASQARVSIIVERLRAIVGL